MHGTQSPRDTDAFVYKARPGYGKVFAAAMALGVVFLLAAIFAGVSGGH